MEDFGAMARKYIWRARSSVLLAVASGEMAEHDSMRLTRDDVDAIADEIVFGRGERLLERCLLPGTFAKVEPLRYASVGLRLAARQAVQRHIGDPPAGLVLSL